MADPTESLFSGWGRTAMVHLVQAVLLSVIAIIGIQIFAKSVARRLVRGFERLTSPSVPAESQTGD
jgi:hypothetical protein